jgi:4-carboxymuconolactone decarboxylase
VGRKQGITEQQLHDLTQFESSPHFDDREKTVLRLATALTRTPADVSDELYAALRTHFSERQLVELTAVICWENDRARFNRTFAIAAEGFSKGQFCPLPEPARQPEPASGSFTSASASH